MKIRLSFFIFYFILHVLQVMGQKPMAQLKYYQSPDSNLYWNKNLPIYIQLASAPGAAGVNLVSKEFSKFTNPTYLDTEGPNFIRTRYAVDNATKTVVFPKMEISFEVIADGTAPITTISFSNAASHSSGGNLYFGKGLLASLQSTDKYSGVENIYWATDTMDYKKYSAPIPLVSGGQQTLYFRSEDHVGNLEQINSRTFTLDLTAPQITHNVNGVNDNNTLASNSTIYFTVTDDYSGVADVFFKFDDQKPVKYTGGNVSLTSLDDGDHSLTYYVRDHVGNQSDSFTFDFYYDKLAPITASDILGDKYIWQDKVYFSGRTKMKLTAIDNKAGVKDIFYSVDGEAFKTYGEPFYLPAIQGNHTVKFYSMDRLANTPSGAEEYKHNINLVFLDLTGPSIKYKFDGPLFTTGNQSIIGPKTKISIQSQDDQSGLNHSSYSIDKAQEETTYDQPYSLNLTTGTHVVEFFAYDNVNNRNTISTTLTFDGDVPEIFHNFSIASSGTIDGKELYPTHAALFIAATDHTAGNDRIYYAVDNGPEMLYSTPLANFVKNKDYSIKIRAIDKVGNENTKTIQFKILEK